MVISTKQKEKSLSRNNEELSLKIQEEPIDNVLITKYLGIQVDRNLDGKGHINALSSKLSRSIGLLPQGILKTHYTGIVDPHFRFCCSVWVSCGTMEMSELKNLHNRVARTLTSSRHDADARPLLNTLGLKKIQDLIGTEINTMVFKAFNGLAPDYL